MAEHEHPPEYFEGPESRPLTAKSANQINGLYRIGQLPLFPSPIFLQINSGTRGTGLLHVLVPPIP
jgi:hypothetical protein